jgi:bifunctional non-homologous end joining protein LigD
MVRIMGLKEYQRKRDFNRTPEPKGDTHGKGNLYLIQKHAARRLHYDLRLELGGVLVSWAIPKGPSLDPKDRRLAVHVEDHPVEYGDFEGNIPKGEYGGGTVLLWDRGTWEPEGDPQEGLRRGDLKFRLKGEKLRGSWVLVRMGKASTRKDQRENWLLIKHSDDEAAPLEKRDILQERPESISTGRNMEKITADDGREWTSRGETSKGQLHTPVQKHSSKEKRESVGIIEVRAMPGAHKSPLPGRIYPQLATLSAQVPKGDQWLHEIKFDGYRALCRIGKGKSAFYTREGNDWTDQFGKLPREAADLPVENAILDGEVVVLRTDGSTSFQALQNALGKGTEQPIYYAFDLLYLNGYDLRKAPLIERKALLSSLLQKTDGLVRFSDHCQGAGEELFNSACKYALEGIISKRVDRPYTSGRTSDWLKIKCINSQEFVIGGFTDPAGSRTGFGALLVGAYEDGNLVYCGRVGTGYTDKLLKELHSRLKSLQQKAAPFSNPPQGTAARSVHWVKPELVAQVTFTSWTQDRILRHPSFQGLREDKRPAEIRFETSSNPPAHFDRQKPEAAGMKITNPDRILYPDQGITKLDLVRYYEALADWALPHIKNRPLMLLRCPEGAHKECFHQKHASASVPASVKQIPIQEQGNEASGLAIDSAAGLIALAQMGVLEIHSWGCRIDRLEQPDLLVFDLDPDPAVPWKNVVDAAFEIRSFLKNLGLETYVKTTGGKGLHLTVPLEPKADWNQAKEFSKQVAETLAREFPDRYVAKMTKARRKGKIYIDYLRNGRGATFICPYSTRARNGAPVSVPIHWDELNYELRSDQFTIRNLSQRIARLKHDPWEGIEKTKQLITSAIQKKLFSFR